MIERLFPPCPKLILPKLNETIEVNLIDKRLCDSGPILFSARADLKHLIALPLIGIAHRTNPSSVR